MQNCNCNCNIFCLLREVESRGELQLQDLLSAKGHEELQLQKGKCRAATATFFVC